MSKFGFLKTAKNIEMAKRAALEKMAQNAIYQFKVENFEAQGFIDNAVQPWSPRKSNSKKDQGRKLLVKTGRLRRSIQVTKRSKDSITVGSDVPYADFHNNGTSKLPKRQFIGKSSRLEKNNQIVLDTYMKRV